ncbi:MAG: dihydrofolate synthase [Propionibacteriaceae bacterium]|jgi:dihydrofolate synthase/folylpolyglutamate synthase|nr:dihydrofolate synthase [Propionibacteriaceae bacterium]
MPQEPRTVPARLDHAGLVAELERRWPERQVAKGTARIEALLDLLGHPQRSAPMIHLTGTNGKGSTAIMIDALLRAEGLRTGRFSSPHLVDPVERVAVDGRPIDPETFDRAWDELRGPVELIDAARIDGSRLTYFEIMTALAHLVFADAPVDVLVVEVGLGGRWDATNVADAAVAVVTPIALDHTDLLGDDLAQIAAEKAGLIKPGSYAVLARQPPQAAAVLERRCAEVGAQALRQGVDFDLLDRRLAVGGQVIRWTSANGPIDDLKLPLHGAAMAQNAAVALAAVEAFHGLRGLDAAVAQAGLAAVEAPARTEVVRHGPTVVIDTCHNPAAVQATLATIAEAFDFAPLIAVWATMADKDVETVLSLLEADLAILVATQTDAERALPAERLGQLAQAVLGPDRVLVRPQVADAIELAVELADQAGPTAGLLVAGSVRLAGQARQLLAPER